MKTGILSFLKLQSPVDQKKFFYFSVAILSLFMLFSGWGTGFHCDEIDQTTYAKSVTNYYLSGGKDTSYKHVVLPDGLKVSGIMSTYGALYDICLNTVASVFPSELHFDVRHALVQLSALLAMIMAALILVELGATYVWALAAFLMIFLTPIFFGNGLMNAKDIPFASFYTLAVFFGLRLIKRMKSLTWKDIVLAAITIGLAASVRIAGILLVPVLLSVVLLKLLNDQSLRKSFFANPGKVFLMLLAILLIPYLLILISCPFIQEKPIENFFYCLNVARHFPQRINVIFESQFISSLDLPSHYVLKWMTLTIPVFAMLVLLTGLLGLIPALLQWKKKPELLFPLLMLAIPLVLALSGSSAFYNRWRHLLFLYPTAVALALTGLYPFLKNIRYVRFLPLLVVLTMLHPLIWMFKNHPFEYIYFNEISGGFKDNFTRYETDGWQLSVRKATDWLLEQEQFKQSKKKVIGSNATSAVWYQTHLMRGMKDVEVNYAGHKGYNGAEWNFLILNVNYLTPEFLEKTYPPRKPDHVIEVDGMPLCVVIIDTVRNDLASVKALVKGNYPLADSLSGLALKEYKESERLLEIRCIAAINRGKTVNSEGLIVHAYETYPNNSQFNYYRGLLHAQKNEYNDAISLIRRALELGLEPDALVFRRLSVLYNQTGNINLAQKFEEVARKYD